MDHCSDKLVKGALPAAKACLHSDAQVSVNAPGPDVLFSFLDVWSYLYL